MYDNDQLTQKQSLVFEKIKEYINKNKISPTRIEITNMLGFRSPNSAEVHVKTLIRKGYLKNTGEPRGLSIVNKENDPNFELKSKLIQIPLVGKVAAGSPIEADEHIEKMVLLTSDMFDYTPDYLLKVSGDSMINIGIMDGDLIAVQKTNTVRNGQIVIARVNGNEVTVKRYKREGSMVWLIPENDTMKPIKVDLSYDRLEIDGIYVGLIRSTQSFS